MNYRNLTFSNKALDNRQGFRLIRNDLLLAAGLLVAVGLTNGCGQKEIVAPSSIEVTAEDNVEMGTVVTSEELTSMGIILNSAGESHEYVEAVQKYLADREIDVLLSNGSEQDLQQKIEEANLVYQSATVISLNNRSYKGDRLLITAPYLNRENTNSDILALSMKCSGMSDGLRCGISNSGTLSGRMSSPVENICGNQADFLEIHLGKDSQKEEVSAMIFTTLTKTVAIKKIAPGLNAIHTIENGETDSDLKSRYSSSEQLQMIKKNGQNTQLQNGSPYYLPVPNKVEELLNGQIKISYLQIEKSDQTSKSSIATK